MPWYASSVLALSIGLGLFLVLVGAAIVYRVVTNSKIDFAEAMRDAASDKDEQESRIPDNQKLSIEQLLDKQLRQVQGRFAPNVRPFPKKHRDPLRWETSTDAKGPKEDK